MVYYYYLSVSEYLDAFVPNSMIMMDSVYKSVIFYQLISICKYCHLSSSIIRWRSYKRNGVSQLYYLFTHKISDMKAISLLCCIRLLLTDAFLNVLHYIHKVVVPLIADDVHVVIPQVLLL